MIFLSEEINLTFLLINSNLLIFIHVDYNLKTQYMMLK